MIGAVLALIFNLLHPRATGVDTVREEIELVADSGIWLFVHFMIAWALVFGFVGLIAIARSFTGEAGVSWGRLALGSSIAAIAVGFVAITIDGMAMKELADNWAEAGKPTGGAAFAAADAVANVSVAAFTGLVGSLFGLTATLFGVAGLVSPDYPKWLGYCALVGGLLGLLAASVLYLAGPSDVVFLGFFSVSSLLFTVWLFFSGWQLWRRVTLPAAAEGRTAVSA
jgi:hypothetical protein